jgi:hypothetical protein
VSFILASQIKFGIQFSFWCPCLDFRVLQCAMFDLFTPRFHFEFLTDTVTQLFSGKGKETAGLPGRVMASSYPAAQLDSLDSGLPRRKETRRRNAAQSRETGPGRMTSESFWFCYPPPPSFFLILLLPHISLPPSSAASRSHRDRAERGRTATRHQPWRGGVKAALKRRRPRGSSSPAALRANPDEHTRKRRRLDPTSCSNALFAVHSFLVLNEAAFSSPSLRQERIRGGGDRAAATERPPQPVSWVEISESVSRLCSFDAAGSGGGSISVSLLFYLELLISRIPHSIPQTLSFLWGNRNLTMG